MKLLALSVILPFILVGCGEKKSSLVNKSVVTNSNATCVSPSDGSLVELDPKYCDEWKKRYAEKMAENKLIAEGKITQPDKQPTETVSSDTKLAEWATRAAQVDQSHQDKCWDQLETRGYGDPNCY